MKIRILVFIALLGFISVTKTEEVSKQGSLGLSLYALLKPIIPGALATTETIANTGTLPPGTENTIRSTINTGLQAIIPGALATIHPKVTSETTSLYSKFMNLKTDNSIIECLIGPSNTQKVVITDLNSTTTIIPPTVETAKLAILTPGLATSDASTITEIISSTPKIALAKTDQTSPDASTFTKASAKFISQTSTLKNVADEITKKAPTPPIDPAELAKLTQSPLFSSPAPIVTSPIKRMPKFDITNSIDRAKLANLTPMPPLDPTSATPSRGFIIPIIDKFVEALDDTYVRAGLVTAIIAYVAWRQYRNDTQALIDEDLEDEDDFL